MTDDLLDSAYYRPLFRMLGQMDRDIEALYAERGVEMPSSRYVGPLITLGSRGPLTVKELAAAREVSHSAMSQTVAAMSRAGLVATRPGEDARTRLVELTDTARELVPLLEAEWRATEAAVRELDDEVDQPLMPAVRAVLAALERRSFPERLRAHLGPVGTGPADR